MMVTSREREGRKWHWREINKDFDCLYNILFSNQQKYETHIKKCLHLTKLCMGK